MFKSLDSIASVVGNFMYLTISKFKQVLRSRIQHCSMTIIMINLMRKKDQTIFPPSLGLVYINLNEIKTRWLHHDIKVYMHTHGTKARQNHCVITETGNLYFSTILSLKGQPLVRLQSLRKKWTMHFGTSDRALYKPLHVKCQTWLMLK